MIENLINKNGNFSKLINSLTAHENISVFGLTTNEEVSLFSDTDDFILVVVSSVNRANVLKEMFEDLNKSCEIISQPFSFLLGEFKNNVYLNTAKIISEMKKRYDVVIVLSEVLLNKFADKNVNDLLLLEANKNYNLMGIVKTLTAYGYKNSEVVYEEGEFCKRGDILDIFPKNAEVPVRISFFGNEIEFIKPYDTATQLTTKETVTDVLIKNLNDLNLNQNQKDKLIKEINLSIANANEEKKDNLQQVLACIENNNLNCFANVFNENIKTSIFELLPQNSYVIFDEPKQIIDNLTLFLNQKHKDLPELISLGQALPEHKNFYFNLNELFNFPSHLGLVTFGNITTSNRIFSPVKVFNIKCASLLNYVFNKNLLVYDVSQFHKQNFTQIIFCKDAEFAEVIKQRLLTAGVSCVILSSAVHVQKNSVNLITKTRNETFGILEEKLIIIGTNKLLKKQNEAKVAKDAGITLQELIPSVGDYIVHETHGIGKCIAVEKININNTEKDYVILEYKHGDKLYLPVENLDSVSKFVGKEIPGLNKLGGTEFFNTKQKVKAKLKQTAFNLVELYAERENQKGIVFPPDDEFQMAFENEFAYTETPDQLKAINDTKSDMQSDKVMDRLICGDVGYGKTEVALRASFKAINAGYQVAFLCPTTILSQQHYNTCVSRMQNLGVNVQVLNRFKTAKEQKQIVQQLQNGEVQLICGTHRLLSKDVKFKNLGLLVLDEEQKFGVADKEKIKTLKKQIDVLTLSATPIPRSLHMALVGIRDISIIETPPPLKMPVITQVVEYSDELLKQAILTEIKRSGQVLIVFNKISQIFAYEAKVKNLIGKDISVSVAHGQMAEKQLENEIFNLFSGTTQVLISTTLIENGIDLPSANTLIVINSDQLGLSQLYQLKGRVGRGNIQAFAYFTYDKNKFLNPNAAKRMEAIAEFTSLGDGYKIAMKDLEIRGAGNVLGVEQSGHLQKVGYAMYVSLLKEAVAEIRGEKVSKVYELKLEAEFSANLPNYYVSATWVRLKLYSEIAKLDSFHKKTEFLNSLAESFGEVPKELDNLCFVAIYKNLLKSLPIKKVNLSYKEIKINFLSLDYVKEIANKVLENLSHNVVINSNNLPIITLNNFSDLQEGLKVLEKFLRVIK